MSNDPVSLHFQAIRQHLAKLQQGNQTAWVEIEAVLEDLHVIYEEMQTNVEAAIMIEQQLLQQNQHYYDLFQDSSIAYLVTDADGVILESNQAIAQLLNVPPPYLAGKPLILYVAESDRSNFRTKLTQLARSNDQHVWQLNLCARGGEPFAAHLQVAVSRTREGYIKNLKIGVLNLSQAEQVIARSSEATSPVKLSEAPNYSFAAQQISDNIQAKEIAVSSLPNSLDGLRVR